MFPAGEENKDSVKISVLIPVYNERWTLRELVRRVYEQSHLLHEVIVVDDASTDGSRDRIKELELKYGAHRCPLRAIYKDSNQGKGAAVATGLASLTGEAVIIQDADLEYNPKDFPALLAPLLDGRADAVYGSRFSSNETNVLFFWHMLANSFLTLMCNLLSNLNLTDVWTGYKVFRANSIRNIPLRSRGFGFEPEITIKLSKRGCRIFEIPIRYEGRTYAEGKKIRAVDAVTGILAMLRAWLSDDLGSLADGEQSARIMSEVAEYNLFLYEQAKPYLGGEVLEVGAAAGNFSRMLVDRDRLVISDKEQSYVQQLEQTYKDWDYVKVLRLDPLDLNEAGQAAELANRFDSVVCFNVLEFIQDEARVLNNVMSLLKPGGRLLLMAPAHQALFGTLDKALHHCRRYDEEALRARLQAAGLSVEAVRFFNPTGLFVWWWNGTVRKAINPGFQLSSLSKRVSLIRWLARFDLRFGLSIFAVGRKPPI